MAIGFAGGWGWPGGGVALGGVAAARWMDACLAIGMMLGVWCGPGARARRAGARLGGLRYVPGGAGGGRWGFLLERRRGCPDCPSSRRGADAHHYHHPSSVGTQDSGSSTASGSWSARSGGGVGGSDGSGGDGRGRRGLGLYRGGGARGAGRRHRRPRTPWPRTRWCGAGGCARRTWCCNWMRRGFVVVVVVVVVWLWSARLGDWGIANQPSLAKLLSAARPARVATDPRTSRREVRDGWGRRRARRLRGGLGGWRGFGFGAPVASCGMCPQSNGQRRHFQGSVAWSMHRARRAPLLPTTGAPDRDRLRQTSGSAP